MKQVSSKLFLGAIVAATALLITLSAIAASYTSMVRVSSIEGGFSAYMPVTPTEKVDTNVHLFEAEKDDVVYMIGYSDAPNANYSETNQWFGKVSNAAMNSMHGVIKTTEDFTSQGYSARRLTGETTDGKMQFIYTMYKGDNRLYQTIVITSAGQSLPDEAHLFQNSFQITR
jgi:hypothetical protein